MDSIEWKNYNIQKFKKIALRQTLTGVIILIVGIGISAGALWITHGWAGEIFMNVAALLVLLTAVIFAYLFLRAASESEKSLRHWEEKKA